ncbi:spondin domain-containing protein [Thalassotalea crassostreae]|uniref:spondin domain-containing protein n=1 Tax=Thalassotalea crassostreae TaxID=1763536 RepID=UPI00083989EE|nr:spondin domain-containing protein [Thalassotalea crassostreae]
MNTNLNRLLVSLSAAALLTACGGDSSNDAMTTDVTPDPVTTAPMTISYDVSVTNLTYAQPLSPIAVVLHNEGNLWQVGESASVELENLAESGANDMILGLDVVLASGSGGGVLMPGMSETVMVSIVDVVPTSLSLLSMLVNTNDAFTGLNAMPLENLDVGESISLVTGSYDSGTEGNSESMATIPGPAAGGEGFNSARDDVDFVAMHPGVVTSDDGLASSALTFEHRFDNPTIRVTITRTE